MFGTNMMKTPAIVMALMVIILSHEVDATLTAWLSKLFMPQNGTEIDGNDGTGGNETDIRQICMKSEYQGLWPAGLWSLRCDRLDVGSNDRIVGGYSVAPNSVPHQVTLFYEKIGHYCGGSVVSSNFVLTAAHCCDRFSPQELIVHAGRHNLTLDPREEPFSQIRTVAEVLMHDSFYRPISLEHDVCLLRLSVPLDLDSAQSRVKAVNLPVEGSVFPPRLIATVTGWGTLAFRGDYPDVLQAVDVPIVDWNTCKKSYAKLGRHMLCAGQEGIDSCQGDSGGALTCEGYLCGIVSWGRSCAMKDYPGVYTNAVRYVSWIKAMMRLHEDS